MGTFDTTWVDKPAGAAPGPSDTPVTAAYLTAVDTALRTERSDRAPEALLTKLDQASGYAVVVVLGDSTGVGSGGDWPDELAVLLGARFPTHKVTTRLFGGTTYGATTTVANGSATLTLDIYNGSVSGTKADYPLTRIAAMLPAQPDLVIISYGHNNTTDTPSAFQAGIDSLVSAIRGTYPNAPVAVSSQNPKVGSAAYITEHAARETTKRAWAATREYGYVPAWEAFQAQTLPSAWVQADGVHPTISGTTNGSALWGKAVDAYLAARSRKPVAATPSSSPSLTVQDESTTVSTAVTQIDFQGAGVTVAAGSGEVVVTIPGATSVGGTASKELLMQDSVSAPPVPLENEARTDWLYQD